MDPEHQDQEYPANTGMVALLVIPVVLATGGAQGLLQRLL